MLAVELLLEILGKQGVVSGLLSQVQVPKEVWIAVNSNPNPFFFNRPGLVGDRV